MLVVLPPIFVANTKLIYRYNFIALLKLTKLNCTWNYDKNNETMKITSSS